jgi:putative colanic acid biosynthesis acetyltransferase WcaF
MAGLSLDEAILRDVALNNEAALAEGASRGLRHDSSESVTVSCMHKLHNARMNAFVQKVEMTTEDLLPAKEGFVGPTFSLGNRMRRLAWQIAWMLLARWTPPQMHVWRICILRLFGADVSWQAYVYGTVKIWAPWRLRMAEFSTLAPHVTVYNIATVSIGRRAVVSQGAHLCTGSHDYRAADFPLYSRPISIERRAWVCASAFVGPGVVIHEGAVLAACGVTFTSLDKWTVYLGNPAVRHTTRPVLND